MNAKVKGPILFGVLLLQLLNGCSGAIVNGSGLSNAARAEFPVSEHYFGMHVGFVDPGTAWPSVPFGTWRLWDANVTWKDLEPKRGEWDFSRLDALIALAQAHNVDVILPLALTPAWASQRPNEPSAYTPGAAAPPVDINDWIDYVRTVTSRYKGRIAYYEMWNEMNISATWTGTPAEIVGMQQAAYATIKSVDPAAQLISASLTTAGGLTLLKKLLDLGYANSADIIGYHFYVCPDQPEEIAVLTCEVSALLTQYGIKKPLWNTETGWLSPGNIASDDQAAAIAVRALIVARSSGIERFLWYEWDNHYCVSLFMTEADNSTPTRAAIAFANLQRWLVGNTLEPCGVDGNGTWSCNVQFPDGRRGVIVWNPKRRIIVTEKIDWTPARVEDMYGRSKPAQTAVVDAGPEPVMLYE